MFFKQVCVCVCFSLLRHPRPRPFHGSLRRTHGGGTHLSPKRMSHVRFRVRRVRRHHARGDCARRRRGVGRGNRAVVSAHLLHLLPTNRRGDFAMHAVPVPSRDASIRLLADAPREEGPGEHGRSPPPVRVVHGTRVGGGGEKRRVLRSCGRAKQGRGSQHVRPRGKGGLHPPS